MQWLLLLTGYIIGACPTAYLFGQRIKGRDIRTMGDGNVGARNAYHELGHNTGILIFLIDTAKGALAVLPAIFLHTPQIIVLWTGFAAVIGHNWPVFIGFRGGRGESVTIGIMIILMPVSMLIVAVPALLILVIRKNVIITSAVLFIALLLVNWWRHLPGILVFYGIALPIFVGITHYFRARNQAKPVSPEKV
jgi:glycerol-3-phosphate acyltransferase PlsY